MLEERYVGGETAHRSFLGTQNKSRKIGLLITGVVGSILIMMLQMMGLLITLLAGALVFVSTIGTRRGTLLHRWQTNRRWKNRIKDGTVEFRPVAERPHDLEERIRQADKNQRKELGREWNKYRDFPDGVDGIAWLQDDLDKPGIAYHEPTGESQWLSVVWAVEGQVRGLDGDDKLQHAMDAWGSFLARYGATTRLPSRVQIMTRVVPWDPAAHSAWIGEQIPEFEELADGSHAREAAVYSLLEESYAEVIERVAEIGLVPRHYLVMRWDINSHFQSEARKFAPGYEGWKTLMASEIHATHSALRSARLGIVQALNARRVAAVLRHLQLPDWPIDHLGGDLDVDSPWITSVDHWAATWNIGPAPSGETQVWGHRTAVIPADAMSTSPRNVSWIAPLLSQLSEPILRTVSFQIEIRPASQARLKARQDATADAASIIGDSGKGKLIDDHAEMSLSAASQRLSDLKPGTGVHGALWAGHITISGRNIEELRSATRAITDAAHSAGIERLDWCDTFHAAAAASTWPVARGVASGGQSLTDHLSDVLAGRGKEQEMSV